MHQLSCSIQLSIMRYSSGKWSRSASCSSEGVRRSFPTESTLNNINDNKDDNSNNNDNDNKST